MNFRIKTLVLFMLLGLTASAQKQTVKKSIIKGVVKQQIKALNIGDKVPNTPINKIIAVDGTLSSANTVDFNDRLLILDFMYTNCPGCIAGLPKKDHLQRQFGDKIKVMVVIGGEAYSPGMLKRENQEYIQKFLTNKKSFLSRNDVQIPWIVENKLLNQYFPHQLVSHLVWIYKGELVAVTEQDYVNAENIQAVLDGKRNFMPVKNDFMPPVDEKTPLVKQDLKRFTGNYPSRYAAVFGAYQNGVFTKIGTDIDTVYRTRRNYIINLPAVNMYIVKWNIALGTERLPQPSSVILEVEDPSKYVPVEGVATTGFVTRQKTYLCYESMGPDTPNTEKEIALQTINDLDNLLNLKGRYEKRKMKCLTLVRTDTVDRLKTKVKAKGDEAKLIAPNIKLTSKDLLNSIVWKLNQFYGNPPVFDETGYKGNVDMEFTITSWTDISSVRKALQAYGLDLKESERELEVFVLTEQPKINN